MSDAMYAGRKEENPVVRVQGDGRERGEKRKGGGGARKGTLQAAPAQAWLQGREKGAGPVVP